MKGAHPVEGLCELLQVSRSGRCSWRRARPSRRATQDAALSEQIVRFHARSRRTYGSPRILQDLQEQKLRISRRRCARRNREHGLQGRKRHRRRPASDVLHHSDQGVQYASGEYRQALQVAGLDCSMSRRGHCYDNAMMESFWSTLKTEAGLDSVVPLNRCAAESIIFDYIECFYSRSRRHSSLSYLFPVAFEQQANIKDTSAA